MNYSLFRPIGLFVFFALLLSSCSKTERVLSEGVLVNAPIQGAVLNVSNIGNRGLTDLLGAFPCTEGEEITFKVDNIPLGTALCQRGRFYVFIQELFEPEEAEDWTWEKAAALVQTYGEPTVESGQTVRYNLAALNTVLEDNSSLRLSETDANGFYEGTDADFFGRLGDRLTELQGAAASGSTLAARSAVSPSTAATTANESRDNYIANNVEITTADSIANALRSQIGKDFEVLGQTPQTNTPSCVGDACWKYYHWTFTISESNNLLRVAPKAIIGFNDKTDLDNGRCSSSLSEQGVCESLSNLPGQRILTGNDIAFLHRRDRGSRGRASVRMNLSFSTNQEGSLSASGQMAESFNAPGSQRQVSIRYALTSQNADLTTSDSGGGSPSPGPSPGPTPGEIYEWPTLQTNVADLGISTITSIAYENDIYVLGSQSSGDYTGGIYYSSDALSWTRSDYPLANPLIHAHDGTFYAVSRFDFFKGRVYTSDNGQTWTALSAEFGGGSDAPTAAVVCDGELHLFFRDRYIGVNISNGDTNPAEAGGNIVITEPSIFDDGGGVAVSSLLCVDGLPGFGTKKLILLGYRASGTGKSTRIAYLNTGDDATDGGDWTAIDASAAGFPNLGVTSAAISESGVILAGGVFFESSLDAGDLSPMISSTDGETWTGISIPDYVNANHEDRPGQIGAVVWDGGKFVGTGSDSPLFGRVFTSTDEGQTWQLEEERTGSGGNIFKGANDRLFWHNPVGAPATLNAIRVNRE